MRCALVIGHTENSPGAINKNFNISEFEYNKKLVTEIQYVIKKHEILKDIEAVTVYRTLYKDLPNQINNYNPDFIISFHCNAFDKHTSGTEVLYYHKSSASKSIAYFLQRNLIGALGLKNRGIIPITTEDRGGYLLRYTKAPAVLAEPFFIDNDNDIIHAGERRKELINAYVSTMITIVDAMKNLTLTEGENDE